MPVANISPKQISRTIVLTPRGVLSGSWWSSSVAMASITIITVVSNAAVLTALWRTKRVPTHYPLASLAMADLLLGLFVMPIAAARELFVFHLPWRVCAFWSTLDVLCCTASILSICTLGWERWCGITSPFARARRSSKARLYAKLIWPVATMVALPTTFVPSPTHYQSGEMPKACTVNTNIGYVFFSVSFSFYIPAVIMLIFYGKILKALAIPLPIRAHRGRSPRADVTATPQTDVNKSIYTIPENLQTPQITETPKSSRLKLPIQAASAILSAPSSLATIIFRQRRATHTIIKLMLMFLICWTPFFIMLPVDSICNCVWDVSWEWCTWLGYTNSALNPLIYAAASPSVRRAFRQSVSGSSGNRSSDLQLVSR